MTELATIGEYSPAPLGTAGAAIEMLRAHAEMMDHAYSLASKMVSTSLVPVVYRGKADDATAAILYGAELGLNPIQSLQQVYPVHGKPSIEARTMVALVKAKGYRVRTIESTDASVTVAGTAPDGTPEESTWTIERADKAGYVAHRDGKGEWIKNANGKIAGNTKYVTDPRAMLWAKAAAEVCRHMAPDVLLGIAYTREDLESEPEPAPAPVHVWSERVSAADILGEAPAPAAEATQDEPTSSEVGKPDVPTESVAEPVDGPAAEPAAAAEPMSNTAQQRKLAILLERHGVTERDDKLRYLGDQFGRTFTSSKELTRVEATQLIEYLARPIEADAAVQATDAESEQ